MRAHLFSRPITWSLVYAASLLSCAAPEAGPTVREKHSAQSLEPSLPLVFEFATKTSPIRLVLRPTNAPVAGGYTSYDVGANGQLTKTKHKVPSCFYETDIYEAGTEQPILEAYGSVSTCIKAAGYGDPTLYGLIYVHGKFWSISPVAGDTDLSDGITHQLIETSALKLGNVGGPDTIINVERRFVNVPETTRFREGTPQETKYIEIFVAHDSARLAQFGGDNEAMMSDGMAILASVNAVFENSGLSPRLRVGVIGQVAVPQSAYNIIQFGQNEVDTEALLTSFNAWSYDTLPPHDDHTLLSGYDFDGATIGLAPLGTMCTGQLSGTVIQTKSSGAAASQIVAHELGHNLSMNHDSDTNNCPGMGFLMAAYATQGGLENPKFSTCSLDYYSNFLSGPGAPTCMNNMPVELAVDQCGDGVVSGAEQCDCGAANCAELDPCCNGANCTLTEGSQCSDFNDACCASCQLAPANQECRASRDSCDSAEACSGYDKACPGDHFSAAGTSCTSASGSSGQCFAGSCVSRAEQCHSLGNVFDVELDDPVGTCDFRMELDCGDTICTQQTAGGECVILEQIPVSEGVSCGDGGQCQGGTCVPSTTVDDCPLDTKKTAPGVCGCGVADIDTDTDGVADCEDFCPSDVAKAAPGMCGCGALDPNTTGFTSCDDECPTSIEKVISGVCGCDVADTDTDADGTPDCNDLCPLNPSPLATPEGGCITPIASGGASGSGGDGSVAGSGGTANGSEQAQSKDKKGCGCHIEAHREKNTPLVWTLFLGSGGLIWLRRRNGQRGQTFPS